MIRLILLCLMISMLSGWGGCTKSEDKQESEHHEEEETVHLKEESQKMIDLQLVTVEKKPLLSSLKVVGEVAPETENVSHVTPPESGIFKSHLCNIGDVVEKGTPICIMQTKTGETRQIESPGHGIVLAQYVKSGDSVDSLTSIMTIANPDVLRASFNVYEKDIAGLKLGQKVVVESIAYPDKLFEGEIVFISPAVDSEIRAIKIRVNIKNEEHLLKFGMFVTGKILTSVFDETLVLPLEAVQEVKGKNVVFVPKQDEKGEFHVKEIKTGRISEDMVQIIMGLNEGEQVVENGSFYLKAELLKGELEEGHAH